MHAIDQHILDRLDEIILNTGGGPDALQKYYNDVVLYDQPGQIIPDCNAIMFFNRAPAVGGSTVSLLGLTLAPGEGITFGGNRGEIDVTKYSFLFTGGGINLLAVVRKIYVGNNR